MSKVGKLRGKMFLRPPTSALFSPPVDCAFSSYFPAPALGFLCSSTRRCHKSVMSPVSHRRSLWLRALLMASARARLPCRTNARRSSDAGENAARVDVEKEASSNNTELHSSHMCGRHGSIVHDACAFPREAARRIPGQRQAPASVIY